MRASISKVEGGVVMLGCNCAADESGDAARIAETLR